MNINANCLICLDNYSDPYMAECGHSFCKGCITEWVGTRSNSCPKCREPVGKLRRNHELRDIVEATANKVEESRQPVKQNQDQPPQLAKLTSDVARLKLEDKPKRPKKISIVGMQTSAKALANLLKTQKGKSVEIVGASGLTIVGDEAVEEIKICGIRLGKSSSEEDDSSRVLSYE